jgi:hypothetical protein
MAERGHRIYATHTIRLSKRVNAPQKYVYDWCTDYRADDWRLSTRRPRLRYWVVRPSSRRVIRVRVADIGRSDPAVAVDLVRLNPSRSWHTDQVDEDDRMSMDYRVTRLGPKVTRLDLLCTEHWIAPKHPTRAELARTVSATWDRLVGQVEKRYRSGLPAKG